MTDAFDQIVASIDYPMVVVTAADDGQRVGCLAGFTTQCSIDPPRWIVCISKENHTHPIAVRASLLVVHVLRAAQDDLAELFGTETGDEIDKFDRCSWSQGPSGAPVLADTDWFAGRVIDHWDAGDHTALLIEVGDAAAARSAEAQLGFQGVRHLDPGHEASD